MDLTLAVFALRERDQRGKYPVARHLHLVLFCKCEVAQCCRDLTLDLNRLKLRSKDQWFECTLTHELHTDRLVRRKPTERRDRLKLHIG